MRNGIWRGLVEDWPVLINKDILQMFQMILYVLTVNSKIVYVGQNVVLGHVSKDACH